MSTATLSPVSECQAANKSKCRYHGAVLAMNEAYAKGDFTAYVAARAKAEEYKDDKEKKIFFGVEPDPVAREKDLTPKAFTRKEEQSTLFHKANNTSGNDSWNVSSKYEDTGAECLECHKSLPLQAIHNTLERESVICPNCNSKIVPGAGGVVLTQQALDNLDPETTKATTWYHSSTNPNWHAKIQESNDPPVVHAGTRLAAWMRAKHTEKSGVPVYLYQVKLNSDSEVSELLYDDEDLYYNETPRHPSKASDTSNGFETGKVMRYVNWWEEPGSVSIMAAPTMFSVSEPKVMDLSLPYKE